MSRARSKTRGSNTAATGREIKADKPPGLPIGLTNLSPRSDISFIKPEARQGSGPRGPEAINDTEVNSLIEYTHKLCWMDNCYRPDGGVVKRYAPPIVTSFLASDTPHTMISAKNDRQSVT